MKDYIAFVIVYTLLEFAFTGLYWMLTKRIDSTVYVGFGLYVGCMITANVSYRAEAYRRKRSQMLNALLCEE